MLLIAVNWIYITYLAFVYGISVRLIVSRITGYSMRKLSGILISGLVFLTVYSQFFSLFYRVGSLANALLIAVSIVLVFICKRDIVLYVKEKSAYLTPLKIVASLICFILWLYLTSRGWQHTDTALYHMQSIRWIENYGAVKGLANLRYNIGYNSSIFSLFALLSMKGVFAETPLYSVNGYFAFLLTLNSISVLRLFHYKKILLSDYIKVASLYYLAMVADEIFSPASDYPAIILVLYIFSIWIEELEREDTLQNIHPYALLAVLTVYATSIKVTVGLVVLLTLKPAITLIKKKQGKQILFYIGMGVIIILPWLIRNVIISGYLIYPLYQLDLFNVDWKVHPQIAYQDALIIKEWGRGINYYGLEYMDKLRWYPIWFSSKLSALEKCFIVFDYASIMIFIILTFKRLKEKKVNLDILLIEVVVILSFLYWQFSAPLPRYGYSQLILPSFLIMGELTKALNKRWIRQIGIGIVLAYRGIMFCVFLVSRSGYLLPHYIIPKQLVGIDNVAYQIEGKVISGNGEDYVKEDQEIVVLGNIVWRGESIAEGFRNVLLETWED